MYSSTPNHFRNYNEAHTQISLGKDQYMSKVVMIIGNQKRDDVFEYGCSEHVVHVKMN